MLPLTDASAADLLDALNSQAKRRARWPWLLVLGTLGLGFLFGNLKAKGWSWAGNASLIAFAALGVAVAWLAWRDRLRKLMVLCYELDDITTRAFDSFASSWRTISGADRLWEIPQTHKLADKKYHGGATLAVERKPMRVTFGAPSNVRCNIAVPMVTNGAATLAFYPDRLLVFRSRSVGAVAYSGLHAVPSGTRFNEETAIPRDTQVVGRTWRYVNKSGGPDRRFKDNREIPVCAYSELELNSESGVSALFMASKPGLFDIVPKALELLKVLERHKRDEISHAKPA